MMEILEHKRKKSEAALHRIKENLVEDFIFYLDANVTKTTVELPESLVPGQNLKEPSDSIVDLEVLEELMQSKDINWCRTVSKLVPLKIKSAGRSGLLRAASLAMWGLDNYSAENFLQRLLHVAVSTAGKERLQMDQHCQSKTMSKLDLEEIIKAFHEEPDGTWQGRDGDVTDIHIFLLSNILRRPILLLSSGEKYSSEDDNITGIYLPLLNDSKLCVLHPLVIAHHRHKFLPLILQKDSMEAGKVTPIKAVPLVSHDQEPIPVRCLSNEEARRVSSLIQMYLKVDEIHLTGSNAINLILTARLSTCEVPVQFDIWSELLNARPCFLAGENVPAIMERKCSTSECPSNGSESYNGKCQKCFILHGKEELSMEYPVRTSTGYPLISTELSLMGYPRDIGYEVPIDKKPRKNIFLEGGYPQSTENLISFGRDEEDTSGSSTSASMGNGIKCLVPGCVLYGCSILDKRCSQHQAICDKTATINRCISYNCKNPGSLDYGGYCGRCFVYPVALAAGASKITLPEMMYSPGQLHESKVEEVLFETERQERQTGDVPTLRQGRQTSDVPTGKQERQTSEVPSKCILRFCKNVGRKDRDGLCITCYSTLEKTKMEENLKTMMEENLKTKIKENLKTKGYFVSEKSPMDMNVTWFNHKHCTTDSCTFPVENTELGLCRKCIKIQSDVATGFEKMNAQKLSSYPTHISRQPAWSSNESWNNVELSPTAGAPAQLETEKQCKAGRCLTRTCDRFGDPSFRGYCSLCYKRLSDLLLLTQ